MSQPIPGDTMASTATSLGAEIEAIRSTFSEVPEIESVFLVNRQNTFLITIIVPTKDYDLEDRISELQLRLMDRFADCLFDFNIVARNGRKATDIITPSGQLILHWAA
jgi:hypothetical protein